MLPKHLQHWERRVSTGAWYHPVPGFGAPPAAPVAKAWQPSTTELGGDGEQGSVLGRLRNVLEFS